MSKNRSPKPDLSDHSGYPDDLVEEMKIIAQTKYSGHWEKMESHWRFCCDNGVVFNWRPSPEHSSCHGPEQKRYDFLMACCDVMIAQSDPATIGVCVTLKVSKGQIISVHRGAIR